MPEPLRFLHESLPQRVAFGAGQGRELIKRELERLGAGPTMLICSERERAAADALTGGLPVVVRHHEVVMHVPVGVAERARAVAAVAFAAAGSGLHHKICHTLGGKYNLPHAQTHAVVLAYVLAFNVPAAPEAEARIARAFGSRTALAGLAAPRSALDSPRALADYGFKSSNIPAAAATILPSVPASNPRPVTAAGLEALLHAAWGGEDPSTLAAG